MARQGLRRANARHHAQELKRQMGTQMAWWCFLDKTTPDIKNQGKDAKWHGHARGDTWHGA
jgi:hypothetical protein